jgi:hypothetical protein
MAEENAQQIADTQADGLANSHCTGQQRVGEDAERQ